jgi:hypothetical protein
MIGKNFRNQARAHDARPRSNVADDIGYRVGD